MKDPEASAAELAWLLDPRLDQDSILIGDLKLSRLLVSKDANYPWLLLVARRAGASEITDLGAEDRVQLMAEIAQVADGLKKITSCSKINIAALGNVVPQLHVHIIARRHDDAAWPRPVWGIVPPRAYEPHEIDRFVASVKRELRVG